MATPQIVNVFGGAWSVPNAYVQTQPANQMLNIPISGISGGNWLIAMVGWHSVVQLPMTVTVGDDGSNFWVPVATSPSTPASAVFFLSQNPYFQYGTTVSWTATNGTLTASQVKTYSNNNYAGRVVNNGTSVSVSIASSQANITGIENEQVQGSAYVWFTSAETQVHVDINWYNSGGSLISTTTGVNNSISAGQWTNVTTLATAPSGAVNASISVVAGGTPSAANIWYVSNAGISDPGIINQNPFFNAASPLSGWTSPNGTIAASTEESFNGLPSVLMTPNGTSSNMSLITTSGAYIPIIANQFYTATGYIYAPGGYSFVDAEINWYTTSKVAISTTTGAQDYIPPGVWTQATVIGQAPSNAGYAGIGVVMTNTPQSFDTTYAAQLTLTETEGFSSFARCSIWAAPNVVSSTTQIAVAPMGQATAMAALVYQVTGMPSWLEVDTATAAAVNQSSNLSLTVTPSQTDLVIPVCASNRSQLWTLDQVSLGGWSGTRFSENSTNSVDVTGDVFLSVASMSTSGAPTASFYAINPLNNNPVFAASTSGWSATNATLAVSSAETWPNFSIDARLTTNNSGLMTPAGGHATCNAFVALSAAPAATPTLTYQGEAYLFSTIGWTGYTISLLWLNASRVQFSSVSTSTFTVPANAWTNTFIEGIAPSGTVFVSVEVTQNGTPPTSATTYIGRATITQVNDNSATNAIGLASAVAAFRTVPQNQPSVVNSNWPYVKLEAAFGQASSTPPDQLQYVDISNRLLSVTIKRGRQYELNSLEAGEADFVLRNDDGFLTPSNPNGPYTILSYTPIRLTAIWQGKIYPMFIGYMERWPETWTDPHWGEINAVGVDAWAMFVGISPSVVIGERILDGPFGYWPCADGNSSTTAVNIGLAGNSTPLTVTQSRNGISSSQQAFGDNTIKLVGDNGTNWVLAGVTAGNTGYSLIYNGPQLPPINKGVSVTWWQYVSGTGPVTSQPINAIFTAVGTISPIIQVYINSSGQLVVRTWNTSGTFTDHGTSTFNYENVSVPMMLNFSSTSFTLYIGNTETLTGTDTMATNWLSFSMCGRVDTFDCGYFTNMAISHVAVYSRQLGFSRLVTYNYTGYNGLQNGFGDWLVSRLLSYMLWTVPHRVYYDVSTGTLSGVTDIKGKDIGSAINDTANTERALVYIDKAGYMVYLTRGNVLNRGILATFGENTAAGEIPYLIDVELDYDPQYVYNDIQVTHKGTPAFNQTSISSPLIYTKSLGSISQYGDRSLQLTSYFNTITQSVDLSNWLVNQYSQPQPRVQQVRLTPMADPSLFTTLLELDVADRTILNRRPVGANEITLDVVIIGVHHEIDFKGNKWITTYDYMPTKIASLTVAAWTLNNATLGKLDSGNVMDW